MLVCKPFKRSNRSMGCSSSIYSGVVRRKESAQDGGGTNQEKRSKLSKKQAFGSFHVAPAESETNSHFQDTPGIAPAPSFFNPDIKPLIFEYQFVSHIGRGAQSDVFLVYNTETHISYAAKVYEKGFLYRSSIGDAEQPIHRVVREIQIMSTLNHPNCMGIVEVLDDELTNSVILVLPYADAGALSSQSWRADPITEKEAQHVFGQIASGLRHIHDLNIVHRDLKPDNILRFSDGRVVIADYSVSIFLEDPDEYLEDTDGTPAFYSPEECCGEAYKAKPADVWTFGMVLYVLVYGKLPFFYRDDDQAFFSQFFKISQRIINENFIFPEEPKLSNSLLDLFSHVLDKNPETRYTIHQVCEHPWLKNHVTNP